MPRQFIKAQLGKRSYTYHNDGEPVAKGDLVKLPDPRSDGWLRGEVIEIGVEEPTKFETKGILGLATIVPDETANG